MTQKERFFRKYYAKNVLNRFGWPGLLVNAPVIESPFWLYNTFLELETLEPFENLTIDNLVNLKWVVIQNITS